MKNYKNLKDENKIENPVNKNSENIKNESQKKGDEFDSDNVTKYGEFVCSEFAWLPLEKQKEKANKFEKITKVEEDNK